MLNGQKLQGPMTSEELMPIIKANKLEEKLPLLCAVHGISFEGHSLQSLFEALGRPKAAAEGSPPAKVARGA